MKEKREKRLEKEVRKEIYGILSTRIKNPYITEMFSITDVFITSDLEEASVYVSIFSADKEKAKATFEAIRSSAGEVRTVLSREMHIRTVPKLNFIEDKSGEYGERIDKIINGFTYGDNGENNDH